MPPPPIERATPSLTPGSTPPSDATLETVFADAGVGLCLVDPAGRVCRVNAPWLASVQLGEEDVLGRAFPDVSGALAPDADALHARARAGEVVELPERRQVVGGRDLWFAGRLSPVPFPTGSGVLVTAVDVTAAKRAELTLRDRHANLRRHLESTPLAVVEWDGDYRVVGYSSRAEALFGFAPAEVLGKRVDEIPWVPEEDWPSVQGVMHELRTGERSANVHANRNRCKDGSLIECEWYNSSLHDRSGKLVSVLSLVLDVTERTRLERDLRSHAELLHLAHGAVMTWTRERGIETWNVGAEELYGFRAEEAVGKMPYVLLETAFPAPWAKVDATLRERGRWNGELRHTRRDGRTVTVSAKLQLVQGDDGVERILEATHDVTERKEAQARAEWLARFPEENPEPVVRLASGGSTVLYANAAAVRCFGVVQGGKAPAQIAEAARSAVRHGQRVDTELQVGGVVFSTRFVRVGDEVNLYAQDITALKTAEEGLRAANERLRETDRRKDEFLAMLSHELRNPLAPIRNAVSILTHASPSVEQAARAKDVIRRQVDHLARLVDDLLDVTRIARGKIELRREPVDLVAVVQRAAEDHRPLMHERGLSLALELPRGAPAWVHGDATRLTQVLGNLLHNAAKFTDRGGRVTVSLTLDGPAAEVRVKDTGIGMDAPLLDRVFDPFVQADQSLARTQGGLGLGLALVKGVAELHGGMVHAESAGPGHGAVFVVRLPLIDPEQVVPGDAHRAPRTKARRVLVVDDNRDAADSLAQILELLGHEADVAYDGPSAIEKARSSPPDVVLCDIGLPGMSGYEVAKALRALLGETVKVVAVSGYARAEDIERAREAGFDGHVAKPPDPESIVRLLS